MRSSNLALPSSRFIGRAAELSALTTALQSSPLVTLFGPPGSGKTRLAQEFTRQSPTRAAWFCELSESKTPEDVCLAVSQAIGISLSSGDPLKQLRAALSARSGDLFILDNCEQLADFGPLLQSWLASAPGNQFIVTSRAMLAIPEETALALGPLPLPLEAVGAGSCDSVQLFLDRAQGARYGYQPTAEDLEVISALVVQLDGLPLAIELAASRMRLLTPSQLQRNLSRRFLLLSRGDHENPRHATLRRAIDWSWELLTPDEQAALSQCSLFRGGFSLEAAESILQLRETPVLDALQSLLEKSLLYRTESILFPEESRYFLYVSVREYAQERLTPALQASVWSRYSEYFLEAGSRWRFEAERYDWLASRARIELEKENLLAVSRAATEPAQALRAALALSPLLSVKGPFRLREELLAKALSLGGGPPVLRAAALHQRGIALQSLGKTTDALQSFEQALEVVAPLPEQALEARILGSIAEHYTRAGKFTEAAQHFARALEKNRASDDALWEGSLLNNLGLLRDAQGDPDGGQEAFAEALQIYQRLGCTDLEALALGNLASIMAVQGDLYQARDLLERSLRHYQIKEDFAPKALAFANLGLIEQELGDFARAKESYSRAIRILQRIGYRTHEAIILGAGLGLCHQESGASREARDCYRRALEIYEEFKNPMQEGLALSFMGSLLASEGHLDEARRSLLLAHERLKASPMSLQLFLLSEAFLLLQEQRALLSQEEFQSAEATREEIQRRMEGAKVYQKKSTYTRTLLRMLSQQLSSLTSWRDSLFVADEGDWFCCLGGEKVTLHRRRALPQLLSLLARKRLQSPGEAVTLSALVAVGWPNERLLEQAAYNRLYVAISTLRSLGLRELLLSREDGWLLSPETPLYLISPRKAH